MPLLAVSDIQAAQQGFCRTVILALGLELKLFDLLAQPKDHPGAGWTVAEIAERLALRPRYVLEWCRTATHLSLVDRAAGEPAQYSIPPQSLAAVRSAGPHSLLLSVVLPCFGLVRDACRAAGPPGVGYEHFVDFHRVERAVTWQRFDDHLVQDWLPVTPVWDKLVGGANDVRILDVGCGSGHAVNVMAARFPHAAFYGVDLSEEAIGEATREAAALGLANAHFCVHDLGGAAPPPADLVQSFDLALSFMVIHDLPRPVEALRWIASVLKAEGGALFMMEVDDTALAPAERAFYGTASLFHCMTASLAQDNGAGLGNVLGHAEWRALIEDQAGLALQRQLPAPRQAGKGFWVITPRPR